MLKNLFKILVAIAVVVCSADNSYSQARSSIGINAGVNLRMSPNHKYNEGIALQADIKVLEKLAIQPYIGLKDVADDHALRINAKYFFNPHLFATAGPVLLLTDDASTQAGGSIGVSYRLMPQARSNFEFSLRGDLVSYQRVIYQNNETTPFVALRVAYNFNFSK